MISVLTTILCQIGGSLLTKKIVSSIIAGVLEYAVKTTKTDVDDDMAKPILEELRK